MSTDRRLTGWQPRWESGRLRFDRIYAAVPASVSPHPTGGPIIYAVAPLPQVTRGSLKTRKETSHLFHLIMTLLTGGIWLIVWGLVWLWHAIGPRRRSTLRSETRTATR